MFSPKLRIIGVGPGSLDYLMPLAKRRIKDSDSLIGARRILSLFRRLEKEKIYLEGNLNKIIAYIKENLNKKKISVLVSGDPGLYSFLGKIKQHFKKDEYEVIPGISALQIAFARLGEDWQDAHIISLHGRKPRNLAGQIKNYDKIFLLSDREFPPQRIALYLLKRGIENRQAIVFERMAYPDENIVATDLKGLCKMRGFGLCAMVIKK